MKTSLFVLLLLFTLASRAQVVSRFTFSTTPLTTAAVGPNGTSVSTSATSDYIGGTLPGIDIDLYFRREESIASFFKRGSGFNFGMNGGALSITFTTTRGSTPGDTVINSGNIGTVIDDHAFHHYRFRYDNNTGVGRLYVDGAVVYTYNGVAGRPLSWTSAGNVVIGENMDATGRNIAVLSNLTVQNVSSSTLPVDLQYFTVSAKNSQSYLLWTTANETKFSHFIIERSPDGIVFSPLKKVAAIHGTSAVNQYRYTDESPLSNENYYRLKMVDADGTAKYSAMLKATFTSNSKSVVCFPNPAINYVQLKLSDAPGMYSYSVSTLQGNLLIAATAAVGNGAQQIRINLAGNILSGVLIVKLHNNETNTTTSFKIFKA
jgi:hypothetical protein